MSHRYRTSLERMNVPLIAAILALGGAAGCNTVVLPPAGNETESGTTGSSSGGGSDATGGGSDATGGGSEGSTTEELPSWTTGDQSPECVELTQQTLAILDTNCSTCHSKGPAAQGNFDYITDLQALLTSGKVKPGSPGESLILKRIDDGSMPPPAINQRPSDNDVEVLETWISQCTVRCEEPTFITTDDMVRWMRDDILKVDVEDRPNIRYFTLTHLYNSGFCDSEIETYRQALSKLVNSLSQEILVVAPKPIDEHRTIFRINLEDYKWDENTWRLMVQANPFAVRYDSQDAKELQNQAGNEPVPFQTGDWLVANASRPPLYHQILNIPKFVYERLPPHLEAGNARFDADKFAFCEPRLKAAGYRFSPLANNDDTLEDQLKIDISKDIIENEVARAAFIDSGVSQNNRVIERHDFPDTPGRAFWISYDFAGSDGERSVLANPIFIHEAADGGEIIFNLPNGLQAYMIADQCGIRLDKAPTEVVTDENQLDFAVVNGLSCMGCHNEGMKRVKDDVLPWVLGEGLGEFTAPDRERILELYPTHEEFEQLFNLDTDKFATALDRSNVPLDLAQEPTIGVDKAFQFNLNLQRAAAEFGLQPGQLRSQIGKLGPDLQALLDGTVKRQVFTANFAQSICDLNLGTTVECGLEN